MEKYIKSILAMAVAAAALTACSQEDDSVPAGMETTPAIGFNVTVQETRGTMVTGRTFPNTCFGITAILHKEEDKLQDSLQTNFNNMNNIRTSHATGAWLTDTQYLWPEEEYLTFYAYSPYVSKDSAGIHLEGTGTNSNGENTGPLVIDYTVPDDTTTKQTDLMTAVKKNQMFVVGGEANVSLNFTHALTAISFKVVSMPVGTLKSISINGLYMGGKYNVDTETWDFTGKRTTNYTRWFNKSVLADVTQDITDDANGETLLMIPQEFTSDDQTITFVFSDGNRDYTLSRSLKGIKWPQGKHIIYNMTINSLYSFDLDFQLTDWDDSGTTEKGNATVEH